MAVNHFDTPVMIDGYDATPAAASNYFCFGITAENPTTPTGPVIWALDSATDPTANLTLGSLCLLDKGDAAVPGGELFISQGTGVWDKVLTTGNAVAGVQATVPLVANGTRTTPIVLPAGGTISGIRLLTPIALVSTLGTITVAIQNAAGTTLLSAATFDAETLVAGTLTALTLTGTTANLTIAAGGFVKAILVSNNADAVGGDLAVLIDLV